MRMTNRAWADLALLALIWGGVFAATGLALRDMGPMTAVFWRLGLGAAALWMAAAVMGALPPRSWRFWGDCAVMGLLNNVIPFSLMAWGQRSIESGLTSILNAATAVFGALVAAAVLRDERLGRRRAIGVALGMAGVAVITGREALTGLDPRSLGQIATLAGALSYAFAAVWARLRLSGQAPLTAAVGMVSMAFLMQAGLTFALEGAPRLDLSLRAWTAVAYCGALGVGLAYLLYYRLVQATGAANALLVTLAIPPIAILLGHLLLDEVLPARAWAGFALIAMGLAVLDGRALAWRPWRRAA